VAVRSQRIPGVLSAKREVIQKRAWRKLAGFILGFGLRKVIA
jgi:hypothetical protein